MNEPCWVGGPYNIIRSTNKNNVQYYLNITAAGCLVGFDIYLCILLFKYPTNDYGSLTDGHKSFIKVIIELQITLLFNGTFLYNF